MEEEFIEVSASSASSKRKTEFGKLLWGKIKLLFLPEETEDDEEMEGAPFWLVSLCAAGLFLMLNQIRFPFAGGRVAVSDIAFLGSFVPMFAWVVLKRRSIFYPVSGIVLLLVFCIANLASLSGCTGAFKCAQLVQYLLCGVMLFSFMLENAPGLTAFTVLLALGLNVAVGVLQAGKYGIGSVLAPADVLKLRWGFGGAYSGLFRSRMAFSFFSSAALAWLYPQIIGKNNSIFRSLVAIAVAVPCLLAIVNGQMLLIAVLVLLVEAFIYSRTAGASAFLAVLLALLISLGFSQWNHSRTVLETLKPIKSGEYAGELKTNHIDFIAALKMAAKYPAAGVGSGRYQENIGTFYGELPNPAYNDIATDTQAGWGIVAGTTGFVTLALLALFVISSIGRGFGRAVNDGARNPLALGGAGALTVIFLGMFISDPLTRGLAWMLALALASVIIPHPDEEYFSFSLLPGYTIVICLLLGLLIVANGVFGRCAGSVKCGAKCEAPVEKTALPEANATEKASEAAEEAKPASVPVVPMLLAKTFKVVNADAVANFTPPFKQAAGKDTASQQILEVLDNAGKPPEGKEPSMEYGGAVFQVEIPAAGQYKIWLNVWWEGSCGNTVNVQVGDEKKSVTAGNDSAYEKWHWVEVPRIYQLQQGACRIAVLNREDGIKLDQILVTNDLKYVPEGKEK